jgi:hypothetical protein
LPVRLRPSRLMRRRDVGDSGEHPAIGFG